MSAPRRLRPERSRNARTSARCASRAAPAASSSNRMRPTAPRRSEASLVFVFVFVSAFSSSSPPAPSPSGSPSAGLNASSGTSTDAPARTKLRSALRRAVSSADSSSSHDGKPRNAASGSDASSPESSASTRSPGMGRFSSKRAATSAAMRAAVAEGVSSASRHPSEDRVPNAPGIGRTLPVESAQASVWTPPGPCPRAWRRIMGATGSDDEAGGPSGASGSWRSSTGAQPTIAVDSLSVKVSNSGVSSRSHG